MNLPVLDVLPQLRGALAASPVTLLQAPPGAGKSTAVPLELLNEPWLADQRILLLQPRRVAARAVAARMADVLGEDVGRTVGYRVRFESRVSAATRIEVITEGILTRRLQRDPTLEGVGLVIFDEFHERSLNADLAFVLSREAQAALREDLRLLVMSATLEEGLQDRLAPGAPLVVAEGRQYPVDVRYLPTDPAGRVSDTVAGAVRSALDREQGDILAFLPGTGEIRAVQAALHGEPDVAVLPLYGDLPPAEQRRAILPDPQGRRRVVLATSIAETSLTLEGVRVVIDSGYARRTQHDPATGLSRLVTVRVTRDAADQRAGRAGRTAPGVCVRLWSERTHALLLDRRVPEILEADLAPLVLELAQWGVPDPGALDWPDLPPARSVAAARELLERLGALEEGRVTPVGRRMLDLPTHPRIAHLLDQGRELGLGALAADVAALLEERDPLGRAAGADLSLRVQALRGRGGADRAASARIEQLAKQWRSALGVRPEGHELAVHDVGTLVALAYPERVARRRGDAQAPGGARYRMAGGRGVILPDGDPLVASEYLAVAHLDAGAGEGRVYLAAELDPAALEPLADRHDVVRWDSREGGLVARSELRYGELVLSTRPLRDPPAGQVTAALLDGVRAEGLNVLHWSRDARQWQARVLSLHAWRPNEGWPDVSDAALLESLETWLAPHLHGVRRRADLERVDAGRALLGLLHWPHAGQLDTLAPTRLTVPSGSDVRLEYAPDGSPPVLAVKLQEMFGLADTPTVNDGRTPVVLHLLSPAQRPVQVTQDLRSFWQNGYPVVRKELRGQYPRHPWPEDPWSAPPTRRVKPRGT